MIDYKYKLPSWYLHETPNGQYNNPELILPGILTTTSYDLGEFLRIIHNSVITNRRLIFVDGQVVPVVHNWIRDAVHIMKASKHFEYRMKDYMDFLISRQTEEGFFFELIKQLDDAHHTYVNEDCRKVYAEDNVALTRLELEADVEYLMVEGVLQYYRSSGDLEFVKKVIHNLEKGIEYMITSPKRYSKEYGLIIRPYTIDTWDFTDNPRCEHDRKIHDDDTMCAMHGDNTGVYRAMLTLSYFNELLKLDKVEYWKQKAEELKKNIFKYLWNGKFFMHQFVVKGTPLDDKEGIRLSLSNPYDINRGITTAEQAASIIEEYQVRKKTTDAFLEYFAIDPAYDKFLKYKPGEYVNGSISPFTAGELALASFDNGYSKYGYEIIQNMMKIVLKEKNISFLYNRHYDGTQNESGPSAWGAAALINAVDEGLFGIKDKSCLYKDIVFAPKMTITEFEETRFFTGYEQSNVFLDIRYTHNEEGFRYDLYSKDVWNMECKLLIPEGKDVKEVYLNGNKIDFNIVTVNQDRLVTFDCENHNHTEIQCLYK